MLSYLLLLVQLRRSGARYPCGLRAALLLPLLLVSKDVSPQGRLDSWADRVELETEDTIARAAEHLGVGWGGYGGLNERVGRGAV